jgi:hypothetical protein
VSFHPTRSIDRSYSGSDRTSESDILDDPRGWSETSCAPARLAFLASVLGIVRAAGPKALQQTQVSRRVLPESIYCLTYHWSTWRLPPRRCLRISILTSLHTLMHLRSCPAHQRQTLDALPHLTRHDVRNRHYPPTLLRSAFGKNRPQFLSASSQSVVGLRPDLSSTLRTLHLTLLLRCSHFYLQRPHLALPPHLRCHPVGQQCSLRRR